MISRQHECIFIHQRKCAGMAVMKTFGLLPDNPDYHFMNDGVLSPDYPRRPAGYFVFSVVRNPWDRFVSGWKYCASTRSRPLRDVLLDLPREGHDYRHLTRPQVDILFDAQGRCVADFLMRYESLQQDFDTVCDRLARSRAMEHFARIDPMRHQFGTCRFDIGHDQIKHFRRTGRGRSEALAEMYRTG